MTRLGHKGRNAAFTLVEVLVAVLVFGLLASITYTGLNTLTEASAVQRERAAEFAQLQRVVALLDRDLRQLINRPVRRSDNSIAPALAGDSNRLAATRAGWSNPADQPRSQLQRFQWQLQADQLIRSYWPVTDAIAGSTPIMNLSINEVQGLTLRYRDQVGQWHNQWPVDGRMDSLPSAIEYRLQSQRFGEIRRLLLL